MENLSECHWPIGLPSHVCDDQGGGNKDVSVFMIMDQGCNHGSLMWGKWVIIAFSTIIWNDWRFARSTHNTHIEWTWVEVGACFVQWWAPWPLCHSPLNGLIPPTLLLTLQICQTRNSGFAPHPPSFRPHLPPPHPANPPTTTLSICTVCFSCKRYYNQFSLLVRTEQNGWLEGLGI